MRSWQFGLALAPFLFACGSSHDAPTDAGADVDAGKSKPRDAGGDTGTGYVTQGKRCVRDDDAGAPIPWTIPTVDGGGDGGDEGGLGDGGTELPRGPQVVAEDGVVASLPVFVPITYAGDYARDEIEDFVASVGCTTYWRAVAAEYGVADGISGTPIHLTEPPPTTITDTQIRTWLSKKISTDPLFPKPTVNVVYAIYYPDGTTVTAYGGQGCSSFGGYHSSMTVGSKPVAYAVMPRCGGSISNLTNVTSHELIEYATDPIPGGYQSVGDIDIAWAVYGSSEVGDMCQYGKSATYTPSDYPFAVQRSWSNKAAWNRDDPCVPAVAPVYFIAAPVLTDTVTMSYYDFPTKTRGLKLAVGETRTIDIAMIANGSTQPWTVQAQDLSPSLGGGPTLKLTLDKTTGNAGDVLKLTVERTGTNSSTNAAPFIIRSSQKNGPEHGWFAVAGD
ncbi:hypothetical protein BH09MYX1_BH09MYX1_23050 [soil metagenome]